MTWDLFGLPGKKTAARRRQKADSVCSEFIRDLQGIALCDFPAEGSALPNYPANDALKRADDVIAAAYSRLVKIPSRLYRTKEEEKFLLGRNGKVIHNFAIAAPLWAAPGRKALNRG